MQNTEFQMFNANVSGKQTENYWNWGFNVQEFESY